MRPAFVDASFIIAFLFASEDHHERARQLVEAGGLRMFTTREMVFEVLAKVSRWGPMPRRIALNWALPVLEGTGKTACVQTTLDHVLAAAVLYSRRPDQRYSLVDCLSMTMMDELGIPTVLTFDRDFHGEGRYTVLPGPGRA